VGRTCHRCRNL